MMYYTMRIVIATWTAADSPYMLYNHINKKDSAWKYGLCLNTDGIQVGGSDLSQLQRLLQAKFRGLQFAGMVRLDSLRVR